jgi:capsular exopolysaccharide synthesis family protein
MSNAIVRSGSNLPTARGPMGTPPDGEAGGAVEVEESPFLVAWGLFRRNLWLILATGLLGFGIAAYIVFSALPEYQARSVIRIIDRRSALMPGVDAGAALRLSGNANEVLTQIQLLKSRGLLGQVADAAGLRVQADPEVIPPQTLVDVATDPATPEGPLTLHFEDAGVRARFAGIEAAAPYGAPLLVGGVRMTVTRRPEVDSAGLWISSRDGAIDHLDRSLRAWPREGTGVVDIEYVSVDPRTAQAVVNQAAEKFREFSMETSQEEAERRRVFLQEQVANTDSLFRQAQLALSTFRSREGVFSSQGQMMAEQTGLLTLDVRLAEIEADREMYRSLLAGLRGPTAGQPDALQTLLATPAVAANPVIINTVGRLQQLEATRDSLTAGPYGRVAGNEQVQAVTQMINTTRASLVEGMRSHVSALDAQIASLQALRGRNATELRAQPPVEAEEVRLVQRVETLGQVADQLLEELERARMSEAVETGQVDIVDAAPLPTLPVGAGRVRKLVFGLILGLAAGGAAAYVRENTNRSIRGREDLEELLRVPVLALVPQFAAAAVGTRRRRFPLLSRNGSNGAAAPKPSSTGIITLEDARSPGAEAFRTLRTNLIFARSVQELRTLVVTSSAPAEGKTTTVANLAVSFAQQGIRVLLIDCDLRKPRAHEVFVTPREPGITNLVVTQTEFDEMIRSTGVEGLSFLPAGTLPPNPSEVLGGSRFRETLTHLSANFDLVLLDTPPLLAASDAAIIGRNVDGVLLVVRAGHVDRVAIRQAIRQLANVGANVVGAVLNDPDGAVAKHGGYHHYEYYGVES